MASYCFTLESDFQATPEDLTELTPPQIAYQKWCPNLRLGWNAPSLQAVMKRKATDPLDDQPIISLVQKGADSSKRAVKKVRVSKPQPKDTPTPGADENQLKSLADAAITEVIYDINTEEENPDALDPIDDLLLSDEENTRVDLTKSPELILGD